MTEGTVALREEGACIVKNVKKQALKLCVMLKKRKRSENIESLLKIC